jgi:translation elongation factor EF-Ts
MARLEIQPILYYNSQKTIYHILENKLLVSFLAMIEFRVGRKIIKTEKNMIREERMFK